MEVGTSSVRSDLCTSQPALSTAVRNKGLYFTTCSFNSCAEQRHVLHNLLFQQLCGTKACTSQPALSTAVRNKGMYFTTCSFNRYAEQRPVLHNLLFQQLCGTKACTSQPALFNSCADQRRVLHNLLFQQLCGTKSQRHVLHNGNGETRTVTSTSTQLLSPETLTSYFFKCCFTSTETVRTVRDGETRAATSPFTQLLGSVNSSDRSSFIVLYVHTHHKAY